VFADCRIEYGNDKSYFLDIPMAGLLKKVELMLWKNTKDRTKKNPMPGQL